MGSYINPGNKRFAAINTVNYVDKTMLIDLVNQTVEADKRLTCISRPRRFGKSYAARMLTAYYDCSCDSHSLFDDKRIARTENYEKYINKYNVISLDITNFTSKAFSERIPLIDIPSMMISALSNELDRMIDPSLRGMDLLEKMKAVADESGHGFIFIIDEWDAPIREAKDDPDAQKAYLTLLRRWFKNETFTTDVVAAAYMTGILPIKTDGSQSALSDFREYTMLYPGDYAEYIGFTEREVEEICFQRNVDFKTVKAWYNGYSFPHVGAVYNPNSVMEAIRSRSFRSYWTQTSASESLMEYICKDYSGLAKTVAELVGGIEVKVNTEGFANDLTTFRGKDDVLTLLVHLGYLAYNEENGTVRIPNEEIKREFQTAIHAVPLEESMKRLQESEKLFKDTLEGNEEAVAEQIEKIHREEMVPLNYNSEASLRSVIKLAYYTYRDHYLQLEELPAGDGYADVVYLPLLDANSTALIIELKWDKSAEGAIGQILDRKYPDVLKNYRGEILLVGINYDKDDRTHTCRIVRQHR